MYTWHIMVYNMDIKILSESLLHNYSCIGVRGKRWEGRREYGGEEGEGGGEGEREREGGGESMEGKREREGEGRGRGERERGRRRGGEGEWRGRGREVEGRGEREVNDALPKIFGYSNGPSLAFSQINFSEYIGYE